MKYVFILHAQVQTITSHSSPTELAQDTKLEGCWPWKSAETLKFCADWRCQQCLVVCSTGLGTRKWVAPSNPCIPLFPFWITLGPQLSGYRKEECSESLEDQQVAGETALLCEVVVMWYWLSAMWHFYNVDGTIETVNHKNTYMYISMWDTMECISCKNEKII